MTNQNKYAIGEEVIILRESKDKVITKESARVVKFGSHSVFVQLANGDVIKRSYRRIVGPVSGGSK